MFFMLKLLFQILIPAAVLGGFVFILMRVNSRLDPAIQGPVMHFVFFPLMVVLICGTFFYAVVRIFFFRRRR